MSDGDDHTDGYAGPATLTLDGRALAVHVVLDARHEPQDGRLHWFGRLRADGAGLDLADATAPRAAAVQLDAGAGPVAAQLGEVDFWGRVRVTGVGRPPYAVPEPVIDDGSQPMAKPTLRPSSGAIST
jgi:Domain of unknown function (DUF4873)